MFTSPPTSKSYQFYTLNPFLTISLPRPLCPSSRKPPLFGPRWRGPGLGDPSMRSYAGETGQGPNSVGTSDRNSSEGLHLFPPCVTPSAEPIFLPGISGGSFLPGVEQKAGRKRREGGQGIPTTQCCSPCSFPTPPPPPPNTIPGLIFSNTAHTLVTPCHPPTRQEAGAVIHQLRGGIWPHPGPLSPSPGWKRPAE